MKVYRQKKITILEVIFLLSLFFILMFSFTSEAAPKTGLVMVGKSSVPPKVDGVLNDACWQKAIELSPFILLNQHEFANEQTKAYLSYDKNNLYLAFRCEASCLNPVNNQLGSFKKDTSVNDDDKIFKDDCIAIFLDTNRDENSFFDIFINGLGTVNDAECQGPNPWRSRDKTWNSQAKVSTKIENGYWIAEISIPFSSLKVSTKLKDSWRVRLGRIEQNKKETSSWQPMKTGFHNAKEFGQIVFGKDVPGVKAIQTGNFNLGKNKLIAEVVPQFPDSTLRIETVVKFSKGRRKRSFQDYKLTKKDQLRKEYFLDKDGDFSFQYQILNPASFEVYYRSPLYFSNVKLSALKANITAESTYKLYVNGKKAGQNSIPLVKGENIIRIESDKPLKAKFSVGNFNFAIDDTWKKGKGYFEKTILLNHSRFWPNWKKDGISIAQNSIQQLFLVPEGIKGKLLTNYNFFIEVPEEFKVLGASGYYNKKFFLKDKNGKIVKRGNKNYKKYLITTPDPVSFQNIVSDHLFCAILIQLPILEKKIPSNKTTFYYYLQAQEGKIEEIPQKLKVNILPPLRGKQPKKYVLQLWTGWLHKMADKICQSYMVSSFVNAGFNEQLACPVPKGVNIKKFVGISFASWVINLVPYLSKHPEEALLDNEGVRRFIPENARKNDICTTLLLEDSRAWKYVEEKIGELVKKEKVDRIIWDFEFRVWSSHLSCYCPRCLKEFKEFAQISSSTKLTPANIKKNHPKAWIKFINMRVAKLAGKFRKAVKKVNPDAIFEFYSGYQSEHHKEYYGINWKMLADNIDVAICGYGRPEKELADTLNALGKTPLVLGKIIYPYDIKKQTYPNYASKATVLRRAVDGTGGVMIYKLTSLDGRTLYSVAEISRLITDYENLFVSHYTDNSLVKVSGISKNDITVFTDGKTRLILLINESKTKKNVKIINQNFRKNMKVLDYYQAKDLGNSRQITTDILPNDVKAFVVKATK